MNFIYKNEKCLCKKSSKVEWFFTIQKCLLLFISITLLASCGGGNSNNKDSYTSNSNKKIYNWRMTTTWPIKFPVVGEAAEKYAQWVEDMSDGQIIIKVYGGNELIPPLQAFDAVSKGTFEMGSGASYYWTGKLPEAPFFAAVPFGMNARETTSWLETGGGYELWKKAYAKFNLVPYLAGNTGMQMGGWFNKEINSIDDFKGLKMRIPGLGGKVMKKAGAAVTLIAGGDLFIALDRGVIDATEWIGPYHDYTMGFYKAAKYYYYPGWHELSTQLEFFINKKLHDGLPKHLQAILEAASKMTQIWVSSEFDRQNGDFLKKLVEEKGVKLREFNKEIIDGLRKYSEEVIEEMIANNPAVKEIYESYSNFKDKTSKWSNLTGRAYYNKIKEN